MRVVQLEVRIVTAIIVKAPVEKQKLTEAGPLDSFEKLFGYDLVRIDVSAVHRGDATGMAFEWLHERDSPKCLEFSAICSSSLGCRQNDLRSRQLPPWLAK